MIKILIENKWSISYDFFSIIIDYLNKTNSNDIYWTFIRTELYNKIDSNLDCHLICWKLLLLLHFLTRYGNKSFLTSCTKHQRVLLEISTVKTCTHPKCCFFARLNPLYFDLLWTKIEFLLEHQSIRGDLVVNDSNLNEFAQSSDTVLISLCENLLENMQKLLRFQSEVLLIEENKESQQLDQLLLDPIKICLVEADNLYSILYAVMNRISTRASLESQFNELNRKFRLQFKQLRLFYKNSKSRASLNDCLQIPELIDEPPEFLRFFEQSENLLH
ncbi:hypothetical protein SSS_06931 [Sarcoptes scabiei]|nr:hypothetical protein SSS_06931 [Sarcoptes scabiei]